MVAVSPLGAFVNLQITQPFVWGQSDCLMMCADWVERVTGRDPARDWRGMYDSRATAHRASGFLRAPEAVTSEAFEGVAGLPRGEGAPAVGDVGLLNWTSPDGRHEVVGAIACTGVWICRAPEHGITEVNARLVGLRRFWRVGYDDAA